MRLILDGNAKLTFVPLNYEALFSALVITHFCTPLRGEGVKQRIILYETMVRARRLAPTCIAEA